MKLIIKRFNNRDDMQLGEATYGDFQCFTIEKPWRKNKTFISCIPTGTYKCKKIISPANGHCFEILDVDGRTHIQGHIANYVRNVVGFIGFGDAVRRNDSPWITNSSKTFRKLMSLLPNEFEIVIS